MLFCYNNYLMNYLYVLFFSILCLRSSHLVKMMKMMIMTMRFLLMLLLLFCLCMRSLISCCSRPTTQGKPTKLCLLNSLVPKGVGYCLLDQKRGPKVTVLYYVPDFKHSIIHMSKPNIEAIVSATLPRFIINIIIFFITANVICCD